MTKNKFTKNTPLNLVMIGAIATALMFNVSIAYADISVRQDNLTEAEQRVLDDIREARENGTYVQLPEATGQSTFFPNSELPVIKTDDFSVPHEVSGIHCETNMGGFVPITLCVFRGFAPDGSMPVWDIENEVFVSQITLEKEAKENYEKQRAIDTFVEPTVEDKRIEYLENKYKPSKTDLEELRLLKLLDGSLCFNDTLVSQKYREFEVPTIIFNDHEGNPTQKLVRDQHVKSPSFRENSNLMDLKLQVEECIGQPYTKKSVQYDHIEIDGLFTKDRNAPTPFEPITAAMVTEQANNGIELNNDSAMCRSDNSQRTKEMYGCPARVIDSGTGEIPELKDYSVGEAYQRWEAYKADPNSQLDEYIIANYREFRTTTYGGQE